MEIYLSALAPWLFSSDQPSIPWFKNLWYFPWGFVLGFLRPYKGLIMTYQSLVTPSSQCLINVYLIHTYFTFVQVNICNLKCYTKYARYYYTMKKIEKVYPDHSTILNDNAIYPNILPPLVFCDKKEYMINVHNVRVKIFTSFPQNSINAIFLILLSFFQFQFTVWLYFF